MSIYYSNKTSTVMVPRWAMETIEQEERDRLKEKLERLPRRKTWSSPGGKDTFTEWVKWEDVKELLNGR